jgi:hypothetical protein
LVDDLIGAGPKVKAAIRQRKGETEPVIARLDADRAAHLAEQQARERRSWPVLPLARAPGEGRRARAGVRAALSALSTQYFLGTQTMPRGTMYQ